MIGIGTIAAWLATRNPGMTLANARRLVTAGIIALGVLLAVGGFSLWLYLHDESVRKVENLERDNRDLKNNARANEKAGLSKVERDRDEARKQEELKNAVDEADADNRSAADDVWNGGLFDPKP